MWPLVSERSEGKRLAPRRDKVSAPYKVSIPDFWSVSAAIELRMYRAVWSRTVAVEGRRILRAFARLSRRVGAPQMWASIYDSAQFVLVSYASRVRRPGERQAARELLEGLRRISGGHSDDEARGRKLARRC